MDVVYILESQLSTRVERVSVGSSGLKAKVNVISNTI